MGLKDRVRAFVFGDDYDDEDMEETIDIVKELPVKRERERERYIDTPPDYKNYNKKDTKVVSLHTNMQMEVVVTAPEKYDDGKDVCDSIKSNKPVIVNLEKVDFPTAQRLMDFLSGSCYSLGGSIQRVSNDIFIIAPANVDLSGDFKEELRNKGILLPLQGMYKENAWRK